VHEIFISYSSRHRDVTRELAAALEAQHGEGAVWWDQALESRGSYAAQISAALEASRVVVVIWTDEAALSDWVYSEAQHGRATSKLVNVRPAGVRFSGIPQPFNIHHIDDADDHERILSTVAKVWNGTPIATRVPLHEIWYRQQGKRLLEPKQAALPTDVASIRPTELLQAKFEVIAYADLSGTKAELLGWCQDANRSAAGRLIHGPGGMGKTRLLIQAAAELREAGWMAGFLERPDGLGETALKQRWQALAQLIAHGEDAGLLIVMDYAEARQDEVTGITRALLAQAEQAQRPLRLLLLARSAGTWWDALTDEQPEVQRLFHREGG